MFPNSEPLSGLPIRPSQPQPRQICIWDLTMAVTEVTGVTLEQMRSRKRPRALAEARQLTAFIGSKRFRQQDLARHIRHDHASIIHGQRVIAALKDQRSWRYLHTQIEQINELLKPFK